MDFDRYANSKMYSFFDILYKLMMINIIWFFMTIIGLGVLTIFPATIGLFVLVGTLIEQSDFPLLTSFFAVFKKEYFKSQKIFFVLLIVGLVLYFNIRIYYEVMGDLNLIYSIGFFLTLVLILLYLFILSHIFMVYLYFPNFKTFQTLKYAFLFSLAYPIRSLFLVIINGTLIFVIFWVRYITPISFLFMMSLIAFITIKVLNPKYAAILKEKKPLDVYDYIK